MIPRHLFSKTMVAATAVLTAAACSDGTGVDGPQNVSLNFQVTGPAPLASGPSMASAGPSMVAGPPLVLTGTNGTLTIEEIRVIVNEVELKPSDGTCDQIENSISDDCPEFEAPPRFLDLPLDGEPITAVTGLIPAGTYKEIDFEIEDLEDDEEDAAQAAAIEAVRLEILGVIPDWPRKASTLVVGTFEPAGGGAAIDFRVFLDAEVEIEMPLLPNLVVADDGTASRDLTVDVRPDIWFGGPNNTVLELHLWDYDSTGQLLEFEVEMENGFTHIELGG
jgi:hypothetical protein